MPPVRTTPSPTRPAGARWPRGVEILLVAVLLALFWGLAVSASRRWSHTSDELPHLTAGFAYNVKGDFRLQPENGVLAQRVHGLAPLWLGARLPEDPTLWSYAQVWRLGWDFFYSLDNPTDRMLQLARTLNAGWGVALGLFLYLVARRWYGVTGGLATLALFCFSPEFLFHSAQATSDVAGVATLFLAAWLFGQQLEKRDWLAGALAGLAAGTALTAKFSGLLLVPVYLGLIAGDTLLRGAPGRRGARLAGSLGWAAFAAALAVAVIWALYDFRFSARAAALPPITAFLWPWSPELHFAGAKGAVIAQALSWHLLPEAYLQGLDYVFASEVARPAFLAGQYSDSGWWQFFPTVFLAKTTVALLLASGIAAVIGLLHFRRDDPAARRATLARWLPVALPALITAAAAIHSSLNIGHRHILAVYPALLLAAGGLVRLPRRAAWLAGGLALLQAAESTAIRPHYLAYFNPLVGPERAYRLVVDSSLDWGQDLPALADWLGANRRSGEKLYLGYFGNAWPPHYGVRPTIFLPAANLVVPPLQSHAYEPGLYCISATTLAGVYSEYRGPWREDWEQRYRAPGDDYSRFTRLRFARLCRYLQARPPDAQAGYSILIFRLSAADIDAALHGPVSGWQSR